MPDRAEVVTVPPQWFTGLTPQHKQQVRWVQVSGLKEHKACDFLPFHQRSYLTVRESMRQSGVLFPLAVAKNGKVIDGRYRLRAAREVNIDQLPTLLIDVDGDDAVRWVFEMKDTREHLSQNERAVLAVQYQRRLKGQHVKVRTAKMTKARKGKALCDLSRDEHLAWRTTEWEIIPEVDKDIRRQHPASFPEEIPHRLIKMLTYGRDLVIDPYNGSGTTTTVAKRLGRRYIGIDQSPTYSNFARQRLKEAAEPGC